MNWELVAWFVAGVIVGVLIRDYAKSRARTSQAFCAECGTSLGFIANYCKNCRIEYGMDRE